MKDYHVGCHCLCHWRRLARAIDPDISPEHVERLLRTLPPLDRQIIAYRFLVDDYPHTLEETGDHFERTRERIRQIESRAMSQMRRAFREETP